MPATVAFLLATSLDSRRRSTLAETLGIFVARSWGAAAEERAAAARILGVRPLCRPDHPSGAPSANAYVLLPLLGILVAIVIPAIVKRLFG
jgi:hypothetical protein